MDPRQLFADERHAAFCVFCGADPTTREHVASKALLDDPLPQNLPVVYSCHRCNNGFSQDEEYLACLIECVISGTTDHSLVSREKVRAALRHSPDLAARIRHCVSVDANGALHWRPEEDRMRNVVVKLARGHAAHQFSEPQLARPASVSILPLGVLSEDELTAFERVPQSKIYPQDWEPSTLSPLTVSTSRLAGASSLWSVSRFRIHST